MSAGRHLPPTFILNFRHFFIFFLPKICIVWVSVGRPPPATHFYSQFSPPGRYINPTSSPPTGNMAKYEFKAKRWKFENSSEEEEMFLPTIYEQPALSCVQRETGRIKDSGGNFLTSALQTLSFPICRSTFPQLLVHTLKEYHARQRNAIWQ